MRVPEYGIHDEIKYNKKRLLIRWCIICGQPFHPTGRRDKVCSEECRHQKELDRNFKNNPNYPSIYQPPQDEDERVARISAWRNWYSNLTHEQRQKYNVKKKKGVIRKEDTYDSIQDEMRALGLR